MKPDFRTRSLLRYVAAILSSCVMSAVAFADTDISGRWAVKVEVPSLSQDGIPSLELYQDGAAVGGIYRGQFGERPVVGKVRGSEVELSFNIVTPDQKTPVLYRGEISGDYIQGSVQFGDVAEGTFTARRAE